MPEVSETTAVDTTEETSQVSDQDTSGSSTASVTEPSPERSAPATRQETQPRETGRRSRNPIPYEDHERVVDTFHQRLDALSWAQKLDREQVEEALFLRELAQRDPEALVERVSKRAQQAPGPDLVDETGRPYFSPEQAAKLARWEADRAIKGYDSQLGKRLERLEGYVSKGEAVETAQQQLARARQWPGFNDAIGEIADYVERANQLGQKVTLADAYIDLVVPRLSTTTRREVISELNDTSARAVDTINPARRASPAPPSDDEKSTADLLREEYRRQEQKVRGAA